MQKVKCLECGAVVDGPDGYVKARHFSEDVHDLVRYDGPRASRIQIVEELGPADTVASVEESELLKTFPSFQETLAAVSSVRANIAARVEQLEVQVSGIIVRDVAALMLRMSEVESAMGKFDGPLLWDLRNRVDSLERAEIRRDAASLADLEHRLAAVEQVLKLRSEIEG